MGTGNSMPDLLTRLNHVDPTTEDDLASRRSNHRDVRNRLTRRSFTRHPRHRSGWPVQTPLDQLIQSRFRQLFKTSNLTFRTPAEIEAMVSNAPRARSRQRPATNGPRSLIRTTTTLPLARLVTRTLVLKASVLLAAVSACGSNGSPLAVVCPVS